MTTDQEPAAPQPKAPVATEPSGASSLVEAIGHLFTKTWYGHWIAKVLTTSIAIEQLVDLTIVEAIAREDEWCQNFLLENVWHRVSQEQKPKLLRQIMLRHQVATDVADRTVGSITALWGIRNVIAHSALGSKPPDEEAALIFDSYRFGKEKPRRIGHVEIEKALADADTVGRLLAGLRSKWRNEADDANKRR